MNNFNKTQNREIFKLLQLEIIKMIINVRNNAISSIFLKNSRCDNNNFLKDLHHSKHFHSLSSNRLTLNKDRSVKLKSNPYANVLKKFSENKFSENKIII